VNAGRDAWKQQNGVSRTEAKRRYITTLIDTMHEYASPSPNSRELVAELEFVWDQVKSNVPSSSSSSPRRTLGSMGVPSEYAQYDNRKGERRRVEDNDEDHDDENESPLQVKNPMSQTEEELEEEEAEIDREEEEFVDAQDSQYNPNSERADADVQTSPQLQPQEPLPYSTPQQQPPPPSLRPTSLLPSLFAATTPAANSAPPLHESAADQKWRKRVEQALVKMTAEVAALREQLEARSLFTHTKKFIFFRYLWRLVWGSVKHVAIDIVILGIVLLWMRRKKDRRLEGAIRVLLGDAVAQVQKVGSGKLGKVKLPGLVGGGGSKKGGGGTDG
jgi:hypothetical protein